MSLTFVRWDASLRCAPNILALGDRRMDVLSNMESEAFWSGEADENTHLLKGALTIHDHWLSEKEADQHWMSIAHFKGNEYGHEWSEFLAKEASFVALFNNLEKKCGLQIWEYGRRGESYPVPSDSVPVACAVNIREKRTDLFKAEKCGLVILGGFDLTFPVYCESEQVWSRLSKLSKAFDLYLLPRNA